MSELSNDCAHGQLALRFAKALSIEDFGAAHGMLSSDSKAILSEAGLAARYREMIRYGEGPADIIEVMVVEDDWPDQKPNELAWVYVAICGTGFSEAVSVAIVDEDIRTSVRVLEWRRP